MVLRLLNIVKEKLGFQKAVKENKDSHSAAKEKDNLKENQKPGYNKSEFRERKPGQHYKPYHKRSPKSNENAFGSKENPAKSDIKNKANSSPAIKASEQPRKKQFEARKNVPLNHKPKPPKAEAPQKFPDWNAAEFKVEPKDGKVRFHDFNLHVELMHAIADLGFQYCTPIQESILKSTLEGKDATGRAQTGTGKTAAFLITIINNFLSNPPKGVRRPGAPRALIIAPTRELVMQIASDARALTKYCLINVVEVYGGMDYNKQQRILRRGAVDILVATPGRLLDFQNKRDVFLGSVETLVIDEADRMLDMGFIPDVRKIIFSTPPKAKRQTLFFSATLTDDVKRLAGQWTKEAVNVEIEHEMVAGEMVKQIVYIVTNDEKYKLLYNIIKKENLERVMVFANRKDEAHPLQEMLTKHGFSCEVLSGDVDQRKRIKTLSDFKEGKVKVLVATDVASRGIHVDDISHVINFTLPQDPEDYVHRIGRTGRAGASGISISFASEDDSFNIPAIEKFLGTKLNCVYPDDELLSPPELNI